MFFGTRLPPTEGGILVLADFGLTKLNSIMSRSITINKDKVSPMEFTPRYKSPSAISEMEKCPERMISGPLDVCC